MKRTRRKLRERLLCTGLIAASAFLVWQSLGHVKTFFQIQEDIRKNEKQVEKLTAQQEALETQKENLDNPDYLEYHVAPGKYLVSNYGDQIFKFPALDLED